MRPLFLSLPLQRVQGRARFSQLLLRETAVAGAWQPDLSLEDAKAPELRASPRARLALRRFRHRSLSPLRSAVSRQFMILSDVACHFRGSAVCSAAQLARSSFVSRIRQVGSQGPACRTLRLQQLPPTWRRCLEGLSPDAGWRG